MSAPQTPAVSSSGATVRIPHVLVILDGVGHREDTQDNAFLAAHTPNLNRIRQLHPNGLISGSGEDVGLPDGQMGNSEVGHMNLGAGRVLYQELTRISKAIREGEFEQHPALVAAVEDAIRQGKTVQVMGLLSDGGVHSHQSHLEAMCRMAILRGARVQLHAFLDGRDTPPKSAEGYLASMEAALSSANQQAMANGGTGNGQIATLCGRYYAMDRDERWDRVEAAYRLLTEGVAVRSADTAAEGLQAAYAAGESDEFVKTTLLSGATPITDGDSVVFMNFRADRARELSRALVEDAFSGFERTVWPALSHYVMLTRYSASLRSDRIPLSVAYQPEDLRNSLGDYLSQLGKTQLRISETEKYAHVTFFFSGGREAPYDGEKRILIKSPDVATYDLKPEMSALEVTDALVAAIRSGEFDLLVVNYANGDMVGHTGVFSAAVKAVETLDQCLGRVYEAVQSMKGEMLITADHGNVEQMMDYASGQVHTQHTTELVPLIYVGQQAVRVREGGVLADVAPTLLQLMNLPVPAEMTGTSLLLAASA